MTHREAKIEQARCNVLRQESRVRQSQKDLEFGYAKAKAEMEREYNKLKAELEREQIDLTFQKIHLQQLEDNLLDDRNEM